MDAQDDTGAAGGQEQQQQQQQQGQGQKQQYTPHDRVWTGEAPILNITTCMVSQENGNNRGRIIR